MSTTNKKIWLGAAVAVLAGFGAWLAPGGDGVDGGGVARDRQTADGAFALHSPVQSSLEAPVDIDIISQGSGIARITLHFHRPATGVRVEAYGTEGAQVVGDQVQMAGFTVTAGEDHAFVCDYQTNSDGGGLLAVHVTGLFDGQMQLARAASVRLGTRATPQSSGSPLGLSTPDEEIVTDSEGTRVHVMPVGR